MPDGILGFVDGWLKFEMASSGEGRHPGARRLGEGWGLRAENPTLKGLKRFVCAFLAGIKFLNVLITCNSAGPIDKGQNCWRRCHCNPIL